MAKATDTAVPSASKMNPSAHISWPSEGVKLSGDQKALALGKKARVTLEGTVTGYSMQDYGCSLDLKVKTVLVDGVSDAAEEQDEGPSMAEMMGKKKKRGGSYA